MLLNLTQITPYIASQYLWVATQLCTKFQPAGEGSLKYLPTTNYNLNIIHSQLSVALYISGN